MPVWPPPTSPTAPARDPCIAATACCCSAAMSAWAVSIACCCSAWISAGARCATSPSPPRASLASANGPSGISWVTRVSMPEPAIRSSVAATSASSEVSSGGIGSGAADAAGTPIPGDDGDGCASGSGVRAGSPAGGVAIAS